MNRQVFIQRITAAGLTRVTFGQSVTKRAVVLSRIFEGLNVAVDGTTLYDKLSEVLRDGMIWPSGCLGPDACAHYEAGLENLSDFPHPKAEFRIREEQAATPNTSSSSAARFAGW
jgi:hypothetical protein